MGLGTILSAALALALPGPAAAGEHRRELLGYSVQDRPVRIHRLGNFASPRRILVVGCIHGNECAGTKVTRRLVRRRPPRRTDLWVVNVANPDGRHLRVRQNARGVDLNRNFPYRWRHQDGVYESGPGPASEPETQAIQRFVERERPRITLWYHQALRMVVKSTGDAKLERLYSRRSGLPRRRLPRGRSHRRTRRHATESDTVPAT
jgi:murein peptide amidase A